MISQLRMWSLQEVPGIEGVIHGEACAVQGDSAKAILTLTTPHMHTDWDKPLGLMNACNRCLAGEPTLGRLPVREVMGLGRLLPRRWVGHAPASRAVNSFPF